ncbi:uncharacterized protein LOC121775741 [Salvia splendens]|uniref:uncharacterized protein LOC121775741 n=1 Tax=Salvia splendens TaxID=180675 RepID=UPI001C2517F3|nr:uncharacterized protein LOC121775741 [Salvia splendens]
MAEANETILVATLPPIFSQLPPISVKLSDGNFLMWQQQVDVAVYGYDLEGFITGDTDPPPQLIPDRDGESMVSNPAYMSGWMALVFLIRKCSNLETNFASRSMAKVMQYRQQMQNLKKDGMSMTDYLGKMRTLICLVKWAVESRKPNKCSTFLEDLGRIMILLSSLDRRWSLQISITTDLKQYMEEVLEEDFREEEEVAELCEKPGHSAAKCWHRFEQTPPQIQFRGSSPQQHNQGFFNPSVHLVQSVPRSPSASFSVGTPSEFSYGSNASSSWYPDSGATHHVSNDLSNLNISTEYTGGKNLFLGNGTTVNIANIGESVFKSHSTKFSRKLHLKNLLHVPNITKNLLSVSKFAQDNSVFF